MNFPVLIPAYNPTNILAELVRSLVRQGFQNIVVVNDGSKSECAFVFKEIEPLPECTVLRHAVNLGKGAALKTGLNHIYCLFPDRAGVITLDADGQHLIGDVLRVGNAFMLHPERLLIGARRFGKGAPLRSRVGNFITKNLFYLLLGKRLTDTQSGLRGIPMDFIPQLLKIGSNSYEFELDMLLACKYAGRPIVEEIIQTVYLEGNKSSHFNPWVDSMKIYFALFRFALASLLAALIDNAIFFLAYSASPNIAASQIAGRVLSAASNYFLVRRAVFYSKKPVAKTLPEYFLLVCVSGVVSYFMIRTIMAYFRVPVIAAKIFSETVIFLANFAIQRDFIFTQAAPSKGGRTSPAPAPGMRERTKKMFPKMDKPPFSLDAEIFLINPYLTSAERYGKDIGDMGGHQMPLGIYYLAAYLLRDGRKVEVIDAESLGMTHDEVILLLQGASPRIIGITSTTVAFRKARSLAQMIRQELPSVCMVVGGPHMTAMPHATMQCGDFDYGVIREGEEAFSKLVRFILDREASLEDIPNLYYFERGKLRSNPEAPPIRDLDTVPFPARQLCRDLSLYKPPVGAFRLLPVVSMITSRGCPYECIFCDNNTFGRRTRFHSAEYVAAEIKELVRKHHAREIAFLDDTFVLDKNRLRRIFGMLDKERIHFKWTCMTRVNNLDFELLKFMKDHGCWQIRIGIESGSQRVLDFIKKGITLEQVKDAAGWCEKLGICVSGFFMIGHPIDTPGTIQETIEFAVKLPLTDVIATLHTPIPGTESYAKAKEYGTYEEGDWTSLNYWTPCFVPKGLTQGYMLAKQSELYRRFYLRPGVLLRQIRKIRSPGVLRSFLKSAFLGLRFTKK